MTAIGSPHDQLLLDAAHSPTAAPSTSVVKASGDILDIETKIYFPIDGIVSLRVRSHARCIHIAFAGRGDAVGIHGCLVSHFPPLTAAVLRRGRFLETSRADLTAHLDANARPRALLTRYVAATTARFLVECAEALTKGVEGRVARWALQYSRLAETDDIGVTHSFLAEDLGVQRSGVTTALHLLEEKGLIKSTRGRIHIIDAPALEAFAALGGATWRLKH